MIAPGAIFIKEYGSFNTTQAGEEFIFLLRDDFVTAVGAPLATPHTCEPGPGTLVLTQTDGQYSISSGELNIPVQGTPNWGDQGFYGSVAVTRQSGIAALFALNVSTSGSIILGWNYAASIALATVQDSIYNQTVNALKSYPTFVPIAANLVTSTDYILISVLRRKGAFLIVKQGANPYRLLWVGDIGAAPTLYSFMSNYSAIGALDTVRVARLPGHAGDTQPGNGYEEWAHRDGTISGEVAAPVLNSECVHTKDFFFRITQTTLPASGSSRYALQYEGANDFIFLQVESTGAVLLRRNLGGVYSTLGSGAGAVNGSMVSCVHYGGTFNVFVDGTSIISHTDTSFPNNELAKVVLIGTGSACANMICRTLDGIANAPGQICASSNHPGYGVATRYLPGVRAASDTFTHEADCILEFYVGALPTVGTIDVAFRQQDATHEWIARIDSGGNLRLIEDNAGETQRATGAGVVAGDRITLQVQGTTIRGNRATTQLWSYTSATNFQTETAGEITSLGTGGWIHNLIAWPNNLESAPSTPGMETALEGLTTMALA